MKGIIIMRKILLMTTILALLITTTVQVAAKSDEAAKPKQERIQFEENGIVYVVTSTKMKTLEEVNEYVKNVELNNEQFISQKSTKSVTGISEVVEERDNFNLQEMQSIESKLDGPTINSVSGYQAFKSRKTNYYIDEPGGPRRTVFNVTGKMWYYANGDDGYIMNTSISVERLYATAWMNVSQVLNWGNTHSYNVDGGYMNHRWYSVWLMQYLGGPNHTATISYAQD